MILHRKSRDAAMSHPLQGLIIQIHMRQFNLIHIQGIRIHCETMILSSYLYSTRHQVFYRLVTSPMAELQFESSAAEGQPHQLMPQTDPKNGHTAQQFADVACCILQRLRIPRTIGQENAIRIAGKYFFRASKGWHDGNIAADVTKIFQDIALDAVIISNNVEASIYPND